MAPMVICFGVVAPMVLTFALMSGAEATTSTAGRVVGRYALHDEIASGGMATIHIGRMLGEVGSSRPVAIKRLLPQFARDPEFVSMFLEEAHLTARIRHPNVVPVLDVVREQNELFLVMEFIQGETISRLTRVSRKRARIVPMPIALAIASDLLQGLHAAHEARDERGRPLEIVHRDISPHNVMVGNDGVSRVLDFGIAKAISTADSTREGEVKGKFAYMSPEQLSARPVDRRADVFCFSIVLWEMLTGARLFAAPDPGAIVGRVLHGHIAPPSELASGIPASLDALVLKGLARDPDQRFSTASEMALALEMLGVSIARPSEVGAWVDRIAGDTLKQRARRIAEIESTGSFEATAERADARMSSPDTGWRSRSGLRPTQKVEAAISQPDDIPVAQPSEPRGRSRWGLLALVALMAGAGSAAIVWRSTGLGSAKRTLSVSVDGSDPRATPIIAASATQVSAAATAEPSDTQAMQLEVIELTSPATAAARDFGAKAHPHAVSAVASAPPPPAPQAEEPPSASASAAPEQPVATATATATPAPLTADSPYHPSIGQVQAALVPLMASAKACFTPGAPTSRANVTFQSDGTVQSVAITGFAAGKPEEACVKSALSKAHVDAFRDPTYSVRVAISPAKQN